MFGSKKPQVQTEIKPGPVFDPKTIPVHTMQDDLDVLSGKVKSSISILTEEKADKDISISQVKASNSAPKSYNPSANPFLQVPVAAPTPIPTPSPTPSPAPTAIPNASKPAFTPVTKPTSFSPATPLGGSSANPFGAKNGTVAQKVPTKLPEEAPKASHLGKLTVILVGVLVLLGALGGGYFFYMTRYNIPVVEVTPIPVENIPEEIIPEVVVPEKFSADKPNYLLLNVEEMDLADIQALFLEKAVEIKKDRKNTPIEFVVTDSNNNPIAFKIFALLTKLSFPPALLANFQDDFSIFIFWDGENTRLGLNISPKEAAKVIADMKTEEKNLVKNLSSLFLGEVTKNQTPYFQDAQYKGTAIRYQNLNEQKTLSVDYFMEGGKLIIATSKNTAWAIIDKMKAN